MIAVPASCADRCGNAITPIISKSHGSRDARHPRGASGRRRTRRFPGATAHSAGKRRWRMCPIPAGDGHSRHETFASMLRRTRRRVLVQRGTSRGLGSVSCCMDHRLAKTVAVGAVTVASIGDAVRIPPDPTKADEYSARFEGPADERPLSPLFTTGPTLVTYNVTLAGKRRLHP